MKYTYISIGTTNVYNIFVTTIRSEFLLCPFPKVWPQKERCIFMNKNTKNYFMRPGIMNGISHISHSISCIYIQSACMRYAPIPSQPIAGCLGLHHNFPCTFLSLLNFSNILTPMESLLGTSPLDPPV